MVKNGVLSAERHLVVKTQEVLPKDYDDYRKFRELVATDFARFTVLSSLKDAGVVSYLKAIWELPNSSSPEATRAYDEVREQKNSLQQIASLKRIVEIDPKFARAWLSLAEIYRFIRQTDLALEAYQKAVEAAPEEPVVYKALGFALMGSRRFERAIPVWQSLGKIFPDDSDAPANLATCLSHLKRYEEAASTLESAVKINPERANLQVQLGSAYLQIGRDDKAMAAFQRAIETDLGTETLNAETLNSVAFTLAEQKKGLPQALQYAEKAVHEVEAESSKIQVSQLETGFQEFAVTNRLAAFWDTLGWVHFQLGNLNEAEKYLKAAWAVAQNAVLGEHLGQVYAKLGKRPEAARIYRLALQTIGRNGDREMQDKLKSSLAALSGGATSSADAKDTAGELSDERTFKLPQIRSWGGGYKSAEFLIALTKEPDAAETKFLSGAEELKSAASALSALGSRFPFPDDSHARIVRRGVVSCSEVSKGCVFVSYPAEVVGQVFPGIPLDEP